MLFALTGCLPGSNESASTRPDTSANGTVTSVIDGDSLAVDAGSAGSLELRLAGLNAPEADECHHDESRDHLRKLVEGRDVAYDALGVDQFGRTLAHVWVDGRHVNRDLVAGGYAISTTPAGSDAYGGSLLSAEEAATIDGLGIWAEDACGRSDPLHEITIDDVQADPAGRDEDDLAGEHVTLRNRGGDDVDLGGWRIRDESSLHRYEFPAGTVLGSGEMITVTSDDPGWHPGGTPVWNNGGDLVMVLDPSGRVVDHRRY